MSYCPLKNYEYMGWAQCVGTNCALSDDKGSCLIKQFLQLQVNKEMARLNEENRIAEARKNAANNFIEMLMKNPPTDINANISSQNKADAGWGGF
jgi:hypothetical protein